MNTINKFWFILLGIVIIVALAIVIFGVVNLWDYLIELGSL